MITCGECGFAVTAEEKVNRHGRRYTYYHCSKRRPDYHCKQPYISLAALERQIGDFLTSITISSSLLEWAEMNSPAYKNQPKAPAQVQHDALDGAIAATSKELENLTGLRVRDLIGDEEFIRRRHVLDQQKLTLEERRVATAKEPAWFESADILISFGHRLARLFQGGNLRMRRLILQIVGSNPILLDKLLSIEARKPFRHWSNPHDVFEMRATLNDVRTLVESGDPDFQEMILKMRKVLDPAEIVVAA